MWNELLVWLGLRPDLTLTEEKRKAWAKWAKGRAS